MMLEDGKFIYHKVMCGTDPVYCLAVEKPGTGYFKPCSVYMTCRELCRFIDGMLEGLDLALKNGNYRRSECK